MADIFTLRETYRSLGHDEFIRLFTEKINSGELDILKSRRINLKYLEESIGYKAFSTLTGTQIEYKIVKAYKETPAPLKRIFESVDSSAEQETWTEVPAAMLPKKIEAGNVADQIQLTDTKGNIVNLKYGRRVVIEEEVVMYDKKAHIVKVATELGKGMRYFEEMMRTKVLIDANSNSYLGSAVWDASNYAAGANTAFSVNSLKTFEQLMLDQYQPSHESDSIPAMLFPRFIIYPHTIKADVITVLKSQNLPQTTEEGANWVKDLNLVPVMTQWLKAVDSTSGSTAWYLAAPIMENGLVEQVVMPMRTTKIVGTNELRIKHQYLDMDVTIIKGFGCTNNRGLTKAKGTA